MNDDYLTRDEARAVLGIGRNRWYQVARKLARYRAEGDRRVFYKRADVERLGERLSKKRFRRVGR